MNDGEPRIVWRAPGLAEANPLFREFVDFLPELAKESDRGAVLISTSFIDELLRRILEAFFADPATGQALLVHTGALGTFDARTKAAFALGLISSTERQDIDLLRGVRNEFAHKVKVSFSDAKAEKLCRKLSAATRTSPPPLDLGARNLFLAVAVTMITRLTQRLPKIDEQKRVASDWKP